MNKIDKKIRQKNFSFGLRRVKMYKDALKKYIASSYENRQNPLPALRNEFPDVAFKLFDDSSSGAIHLRADIDTAFVTKEGRIISVEGDGGYRWLTQEVYGKKNVVNESMILRAVVNKKKFLKAKHRNF